MTKRNPSLYATASESHLAYLRSQEHPHEIAVVTLSGYKVGEERSQYQWAQLFAASPDMLEMLQDELTRSNTEARTWAGFPVDRAYIELDCRRDKIRALIAKAGAA
jgi:hypothetical protein